MVRRYKGIFGHCYVALAGIEYTRWQSVASRRVLAYVCLRASCSLRTHVRTVTFRRFTRRMNMCHPFVKSVETVLQLRDSHLFGSANSSGFAFHAFTRASGKRDASIFESHNTKGEFTLWEKSLWSTWRARYESLIWIYDSRCDWWKSDGGPCREFLDEDAVCDVRNTVKRRCFSAKRTKVPRYLFCMLKLVM